MSWSIDLPAFARRCAAATFVLLACDPASLEIDGGATRDDGGDRDAALAPGDDAGPARDEDAGPGSLDAGLADPPGPPGPVDLPGEIRVEPLARVPAPDGYVPVGLGVTHGRIVTTCDLGHSFVQDYIYAPDADDHHEFAVTAGAGAFGRGVFVIGTGWGNVTGHILRSTNGVDWEDVSGEHFHWADGSDHAPGAVVTVFYDGTRFGMVSERRRLFSDDGIDWTEEGEQLPREMFHWRSHHFVPEVATLFLRGEIVDKSAQWLFRSTDSAATLLPVTSSDGFDFGCRAPNVYAHGGVFALGGSLCVSLDGGASWETRSTPDSFATLLPTDTGFLGVRGQRDTVYRSTDAVSWTGTSIRDFNFAAGGRAPDGYYLLASRRGTEFLRSNDGTYFTPVGDPYDGSTNPIRFMLFGYGAPSARCPAD